MAPSGLSVAENEQGAVLVFRWFQARHLGHVLGGPLFTGFSLFALHTSMQGQAPNAPLGPVLAAGCVALGLALSYRGLTALVNRSVLTVNAAVLAVDNGPLPWQASMRLPVSAVALVAVDREVRVESTDDAPGPQPTVRELSAAPRWGWRLVRYHHLDAWLDGGRCVRLVSDVPSREIAEAVTETVNRRLGRGNRWVS